MGAFAIDNATVRIIDNGKIEGEHNDGIYVGGVHDNGAFATMSLASFGGGWGGGPNLLIADNWKIQGHDNGIAIDRGLYASLYAYGSGYEEDGVYFSGYANGDLAADAIDNATVRILDNHEIVGKHDDGIYVGGVRDYGLKPSIAEIDVADEDLDRTN